MSWFVYIVECADDTLYTGITNDIDRRIDMHNNGTGAKYTKARAPVKLLYSEDAASRSEASKREYFIKKLNRSDKLKLLEY
jgi:putative endonuclease|tara:strand:- start:77497 stop:77739 length:243 start_codon:yes stop_codon:yes gene_type:complete